MTLLNIELTFFTQLDQEAHRLRNIAKNFAEYLITSSIEISEKQGIIESLKQINSCKIDEIYIAINNFGKDVAEVTETIKNSELDKTDKWKKFFEYYTSFLEEINILIKKAAELEKNTLNNKQGR
jgi:hypothetical protein